MKKTENTNKISIIDQLPHGAINDIFKITGVSRPTIYKILKNIDTYSGSSENYAAVTSAATEIINSRKNLVSKVTKKLTKAVA